MKMSLPSLPGPPWSKRPKKPLTDAQHNRRLVLGLIARMVLFFMVAIALVYFALSVITGAEITVPKTAKGVLNGTQVPTKYSWSNEMVRLVEIGDKKVRQDSVRQVTLNTKRNRYWAVSAGVLPERTFFASDGKLMLRQTDSRQESGENWLRWSNPCQKELPVSATTLAMPSAKQIAELNPDIETDKGTYLAKRAWVINFSPSPQIIRQLMALNFYAQSESFADNRWVLSAKERSALNQGKFKADVARVWVVRAKPRLLAQIQIRFRFTIPDGSGWHIVARRLASNSILDSNLTKLKFPRPCPGAPGAGIVGSEN